MKDLAAGRREEIIADCAHRLGRALTPREERFVRSCGSLLALESVHDMVKNLSGAALVAYLNSPPAAR